MYKGGYHDSTRTTGAPRGDDEPGDDHQRLESEAILPTDLSLQPFFPPGSSHDMANQGHPVDHMDSENTWGAAHFSPIPSGYLQQVNAPAEPIPSGYSQQANTPPEPIPSGYLQQVNSTTETTPSGYLQQVNSTTESIPSGYLQQVNSPAEPIRIAADHGTDDSLSKNAQVTATHHEIASDVDSTHVGTSIHELHDSQPRDEEMAGMNDADSALGSVDSLLEMDTESLHSGIKRHCFENGRRYHSYHEGAYWGPNDEIQNDENDISHHLWRLTLDDKLFLAPIGENPQRILDVGTGTGIWAIDMADEFPSAQVIGTDLSPIQPHWVPSNCVFEIDDATEQWTFAKDSFDFVHVREMFGSVRDWDDFLRQAFLHVKPGGYIECLERSVEPAPDDETVGPDHFYNEWGRTVVEMGERWGKSFTVWRELKERMERAGFVDVVENRLKWPMNGYSPDPKLKELGRWNQLRLDRGMEGYMMRLLTVAGGWDYTSVQAFLGQMRRAIRDGGSHAYLDVNIVYGRKPFPTE